MANPGHTEMRDRIDAMVKMREAFRPFAPAVSLEQVQDWFEVPKGFELPYLIMIADVRPEHRAALPAITRTSAARLQTINKGNREFHA
ncbi:putative NodU family carbamoyl transferase [Bradyrhizobium sp. AZCC 1610]|uniref:carbamoyltransferase C-terminal domain-containing protein n=1 Tax=Bradyrhizobium sp. AZCC 1610 TaxID=3117020 RepID=UPI002FF421BD